MKIRIIYQLTSSAHSFALTSLGAFGISGIFILARVIVDPAVTVALEPVLLRVAIPDMCPPPVVDLILAVLRSRVMVPWPSLKAGPPSSSKVLLLLNDLARDRL